MDFNAVYQEVGSYRGAAEICGTIHKTVKRAVLAAAAERAAVAAGVIEAGAALPVAHNYDVVRDLVVERVAKTKGRISAKRLLPGARAAGYTGSPRSAHARPARRACPTRPAR